MFLRLVSALALSATAMSAPGWAETDCRLKPVASLPARIGSGGGIEVDTTVDGHPATLLFSTTAVQSVLTSRFTDAHNLIIQEASGELVTARGPEMHEVTKVHDFQFGNAHANGEWFAITRGFIDPQNRLDGVLGNAFLTRYDMEINIAAGRVNFFEPHPCSGKVVYWSSSWFEQLIDLKGPRYIAMDLVLDGKPVRAWLSTSSGRTSLRYQTAHELFGFSLDEQGSVVDTTQLGPEGKPLRSSLHRFGSLALGPITLHQVPIEIDQINHVAVTHLGSQIRTTDRQLFPDVALGMDILSKLRVFVAYSDQKMYFTINDEKPATQPTQ